MKPQNFLPIIFQKNVIFFRTHLLPIFRRFYGIGALVVYIYIFYFILAKSV